jgi:hypothetical protein
MHGSSESVASGDNNKKLSSSHSSTYKAKHEKQTTKDPRSNATDTPDKPRITITYTDGVFQRKPQTTCQYITNKVCNLTCGKPVKESGMCGWHLNLSPDGIAWMVGPEGNQETTRHMDASDWEWSENAERWVKKRYRIKKGKEFGDGMDENSADIAYDSAEEDKCETCEDEED